MLLRDLIKEFKAARKLLIELNQAHNSNKLIVQMREIIGSTALGGQSKETKLPEPILDHNGDPVVFNCSVCGAINVGQPPHWMGEPCPLAVQRSTGEAFMMNDLKKMMDKFGLLSEEED